MTSIARAGAPAAGSDWRLSLQERISALVVAPSFALILLFVYGFILWTICMSFSGRPCCRATSWSGSSRT